MLHCKLWRQTYRPPGEQQLTRWMAFKKDWMKPGGQHRGARKHQTAGERKKCEFSWTERNLRDERHKSCQQRTWNWCGEGNLSFEMWGPATQVWLDSYDNQRGIEVVVEDGLSKARVWMGRPQIISVPGSVKGASRVEENTYDWKKKLQRLNVRSTLAHPALHHGGKEQKIH